MPRKHSTGLPSRKQILDFIATSDQPAGKREIARAFGLSGQDKVALKTLLKDMADEGLIDSAPGRAFHKSGGVPKVTVLRVVEADDSGNVWAVPEQWHAETPPPKLRLIERGRRGALGIGDRVLAHTEERGAGFIAHPMKKLAKSAELVLGVIRKEGERFWLSPVEKKERRELPVSELKDAEPGDLVLCEVSGRPPRVTARVDAVLGDPFAPRSFSLIAIHKHGLRHEFRDEAIDESHRVSRLPIDPPPRGEGDRPKAGGGAPLRQAARDTSPGGGGIREDLTHLPIVAIDPADARDHDDAIWAAPDDDPANPGGWKAIVAIADVSYYVRPSSELDREARSRGNSVYFPDRVVPMLPEELSADICSLKQGQARAAMACHLKIARDGTLKSWRFTRAKICVEANIAYEDAQALADHFHPHGGEEARSAGGGATGEKAKSAPNVSPEGLPPPPGGEELWAATLKPLWACWRALLIDRNKREPLELDIPERRVMLDEKGRILSVAPRDRLDAHRLVEDFMIAANVAAARALEAKKAPVMYRVHEPPSREKLVALKDYLATFGIEFALGQVIKPATFNRIIERIGEGHPSKYDFDGTQGRGPEKGKKLDPGLRRETMEYPGLRRETGGDDEARTEIMEMILRTQMQARYSPERLGHFGLALPTYAHFTSPIRRYADLLVHRSLVSAYRLGEGGLPPGEDGKFVEIGEAISMLERRAMEAERDTIDRYVAAFLADRVGQLVECRITGVQPFGFFATVTDLGGDGLVLAQTLGNEYFRYDEAARQLVGEHSGEVYRVGQKLTLRLAEANPVSGSLRFELPEGSYGGGGRTRSDRTRPGPRRGRPANVRHQARRR